MFFIVLFFLTVLFSKKKHTIKKHKFFNKKTIVATFFLIAIIVYLLFLIEKKISNLTKLESNQSESEKIFKQLIEEHKEIAKQLEQAIKLNNNCETSNYYNAKIKLEKSILQYITILKKEGKTISQEDKNYIKTCFEKL